MEAEERPTKLQKLSHDTGGPGDSQSITEQPQISADLEDITQSSTNGITTSEPAQATSPPTDPPNPGRPPREDPPPGISRSQWKKQKRKAEWEAGREDRKIFRKEKNKERKVKKREAAKEAKAAGMEEPPPKRVQIRQVRVPIAFVLDCQFDKLMVDKEIISLGAQVTRSYSDNSRARYQAHMYVSGWGEDTELRKRFDGLMEGQYKNWKGFVFTEHDFVAASEMARKDMRGSDGGKMVGYFEKYATEKQKVEGEERDGDQVKRCDGDDGKDEVVDGENGEDQTAGNEKTDEQANQLADQGEVIYLTSDSPHTLTELKPYHTYIIGGIVDKNRHKGICYKKAKDKDKDLKSTLSDETEDLTRIKEIKTAKLPIGDYMNMTARHVLATNHVVEIMLKWLETGDWGEAFLAVMPKRKGGTLKKTNGTAADYADDNDMSEMNFGSDSENGEDEAAENGNLELT